MRQVLHSSRVSGLASLARSGSTCIVGMGNSACDLAIGEQVDVDMDVWGEGWGGRGLLTE